MKERARILFKELLKLVSELEAGRGQTPTESNPTV